MNNDFYNTNNNYLNNDYNNNNNNYLNNDYYNNNYGVSIPVERNEGPILSYPPQQQIMLSQPGGNSISLKRLVN
jgi:hypothetical protein